MSLDPIKIPQNVYIEDRIVGPLTLKQVLTVALGGGFSYGLWAALNKAYGNLPLPVMIMVWIPAVLSFAFAFIRINDLSLLKIVLLMVEQLEKPAKRVWTPRPGITINIRTFAGPEEKRPAVQKPMGPIEQLTKALDAAPTAVAAPAPSPAPATSEPAVVSAADPDLSAEAAKAEPSWRGPVDPARIQAEPLRGDVGIGGVAVPRNTIFRDLSPA